MLILIIKLSSSQLAWFICELYYLRIFEEVFVETFPFKCVFFTILFTGSLISPIKKDSRDLDMVMWLFENILFIAV
jgi:hypothetical protein